MVSQENYSLTQDANDKLSVFINQSDFENELRRFFKWRKDVNITRFKKLGTHEHDKFIKYLHNLGFSK